MNRREGEVEEEEKKKNVNTEGDGNGEISETMQKQNHQREPIQRMAVRMFRWSWDLRVYIETVS